MRMWDHETTKRLVARITSAIGRPWLVALQAGDSTPHNVREQRQMSVANADSMAKQHSAVAHRMLQESTPQHFIGGRRHPPASGETFPTYDPSTGAVLCQVAAGDGEDIDRAVTAARNAFRGGWGTASPIERQAVLLRLADLVAEHHDELAMLDVLEMGAPCVSNVVPGGAAGLQWTLRYFAGLAVTLHGFSQQFHRPGVSDVFGYTLKQPVGVVGAIIPWNAPRIATILKLAPALAAGCTVVLKPSEEASLSPLRIAELARDAGVPDGVVNVVTGYGATAGAALASHPRVDKVAFTGSPGTARKILSAAVQDFKRVTLELGGKSPSIVFADAEIDAAVPGVAMAGLANSGQLCCAGTRLFVDRSIYDEFIERVAAFAAGLRVGPALDESTQLGPIVSARQLECVIGYLEGAVDDGAQILTGGQQLHGEAYREGWYVGPTIVTDVRDDMPIAREEVFGPVVVAMPFDDEDEVIARSNDSQYGLAAGVWTTNLGRAHRLAEQLEAGTVWVNTHNLSSPGMPFGGVKQSGLGREGGLDALDQYLEQKAVVIKRNAA